MDAERTTSAKDMTTGNISLLLLQFAAPLIVGNLFQMMYNTVDSLVVGNFVGKEALAAVGSTTMIVNMLVFFFNGVSTGAGVVISRYYGARQEDRLHTAVETTIFITFVCGALFTLIGVVMIRPMLAFMSTPDDVMDAASEYLTIYFAGISGLLVYNMGSGIQIYRRYVLHARRMGKRPGQACNGRFPYVKKHASNRDDDRGPVRTRRSPGPPRI